MKPTLTNLAKHINKTPQTLYHMKKVSPKQFELLWIGWVEYRKNIKDKQ